MAWVYLCFTECFMVELNVFLVSLNILVDLFHMYFTLCDVIITLTLSSFCIVKNSWYLHVPCISSLNFRRARHLMLDIQTLLPHSKSGICIWSLWFYDKFPIHTSFDDYFVFRCMHADHKSISSKNMTPLAFVQLEILAALI